MVGASIEQPACTNTALNGKEKASIGLGSVASRAGSDGEKDEHKGWSSYARGLLVWVGCGSEFGQCW